MEGRERQKHLKLALFPNRKPACLQLMKNVCKIKVKLIRNNFFFYLICITMQQKINKMLENLLHIEVGQGRFTFVIHPARNQ